MTIRVFVDANIYIGDGRPPGGDVMRALANLIKIKKLSLITTDVTINEITKHFSTHDVKSLGAALKPHVRGLIKEITGIELPELSADEIAASIWARNEKLTRKMFADLQADLLNIDSVRPSEVHKDYATGSGMFAEGAKKDQIPDAFIVKVIEANAKAKGPITIFSRDGDFKLAVNAELGISVVREIGELLDTLDLKVSDQNIQMFLQAQSSVILEHASSEILDFLVYVDDYSELEGEVISLEAAEIVEIEEFKIDEHETLLTGSMKITAHIGYSGPDMSTAIYDSEDKRAYAIHELEGEITEDFEVKFTMTISNDENGVPEQIESLNLVNDGPLYLSLDDNYK